MNSNQVNQAFEKWFESKLKDARETNDKDFHASLSRYVGFYQYGFEAAYKSATQASESEINSLKQRVEELTASNNQLREELANHNNATIERVANALENVEGEFKYLPEYVGTGALTESRPMTILTTTKLREVFATKLTRTNDLDAAFKKATWIAYNEGLLAGLTDARQDKTIVIEEVKAVLEKGYR